MHLSEMQELVFLKIVVEFYWWAGVEEVNLAEAAQNRKPEMGILMRVFSPPSDFP